jgi:flagellar biosynthesis GTPase FlhF
LPTYNATGQFAGKIYIVRNGRSKPITLNGVTGVGKTSATTAPIGAGYSMIVVNTGAKWRSIGEFRTGNTLGNVA